MAMQTDVSSAVAAPATTTAIYDGRTRAKAVAITYGTTIGSVDIIDGADGVFTFYTPGVVGSIYMLFPGEGILCESSLSVTTPADTYVTVFYG